MKKLEEKVFRDPVYGYIHVYDQLIWDLIQSKEVQRLRRIKQLGGTYMVFHTAEHSRFSHSLGVYEMARKMIDSLLRRQPVLNDHERLLTLCAALLHDLGHGPFSHAFESVFSVHHELFTERVIMEDTQVHRILEGYKEGFAQEVCEVIHKTHPNQLIISLISSQLDADRLDYLLRDAYFTGAPYGEIDVDRILRTMRVVDNKIVYKVSGMHAIEDYLMGRYQMYWQVYLHATGRSFDLIIQKMLQRVVYLIKTGYQFRKPLESLRELVMVKHPSIETFLKFDDSTIFYYASRFVEEKDEILSDLADRFVSRRLLKSIQIAPNSGWEDKMDEVRMLLIELEIDPNYYLMIEHNAKSPYDYYSQASNSSQERIELLMLDDTIKEISEVSNVIKGILSITAKEEYKIYFPLDLINEKPDSPAKQKILKLLYEREQ
ncbi:MAG: HD domain-containing protein [Turicibacter sp.]